MSVDVPWIAESCKRCGRPLKTDTSRELGYGPVCMQKVEAEIEQAQTGLEDFFNEVDLFVQSGGKLIFKK
jgi:hypothetical protein